MDWSVRNGREVVDREEISIVELWSFLVYGGIKGVAYPAD